MEGEAEIREEHVSAPKTSVSPVLSSFGDQRHCFPSHMQVTPCVVPLTELVESRCLSLATKDVLCNLGLI